MMQDTLAALLEARELERAKELLSQAAPSAIAEALQGLSPANRLQAFQLLDTETSMAVFEAIDPSLLRGDAPLVPMALTPGAARLLLAERQFETLDRLLAEMHPVDVARMLAELPDEEAVISFRLLPKDMAVQVFEQMEGAEQQRLLHSFTDERSSDLLDAMSPDDRTRLLDEAPAGVAHRLVQLLSPVERASALTLLGYPDSSAGRLMTPDVIDLRAGMTIAEALARIRQLAMDKETIYYAYVTDNTLRILGAVSLKELVLADPGTVIEDIMTPSPKLVTTHTDQEEVAAVLRDYDLLAVPVVDSESRLVGIITYDDVIDVIEAEATEDIYRFGGVPVTEQSYFRANVFTRSRRRLIWLFVLLLVNTITGAVIAGQEEMLVQIAILAAFIPLLIGTGGNIGAQSSTIVVRGLATGEIGPRRAMLTVSNEVAVGVLLGAALGVLTYVWAYFLGGRDAEVATVVSTTLAAIAIMATLVGAGLPFLFRIVNVDPAVASAPLVTTVMDIFGVALYFLIANLLLRL